MGLSRDRFAAREALARFARKAEAAGRSFSLLPTHNKSKPGAKSRNGLLAFLPVPVFSCSNASSRTCFANTICNDLYCLVNRVKPHCIFYRVATNQLLADSVKQYSRHLSGFATSRYDSCSLRASTHPLTLPLLPPNDQTKFHALTARRT